MSDTDIANEIATFIADGKYKDAQDAWQSKTAALSAKQMRSLKYAIEQAEREIRESRHQPQGGEDE